MQRPTLYLQDTSIITNFLPYTILLDHMARICFIRTGTCHPLVQKHGVIQRIGFFLHSSTNGWGWYVYGISHFRVQDYAYMLVS